MSAVGTRPNYFADAALAERYAEARPYYHPLLVERLRAMLPVGFRAASALDVGCGTGQSSLALTALANTVTGIDSAGEMLAQAIQHEHVRYLEASAEMLPFAASAFDLVTVGSAIHWFDLDKFLGEIARVLRPGGHLAIYNDGFGGRMLSNPGYAEWNAAHYVRHYPTPPRNTTQLTGGIARGYGLAEAGAGEFEHLVTFSPAGLVTYLTTQSNVAAALETKSIEQVVMHLTAEVTPLFDAPTAEFVFHCSVDLFRLDGVSK